MGLCVCLFFHESDSVHVNACCNECRLKSRQILDLPFAVELEKLLNLSVYLRHCYTELIVPGFGVVMRVDQRNLINEINAIFRKLLRT